MTKKRPLLVLLVVAGLLAGFAAYAYLTKPEPAATVENFDRYVCEGMSQRQVEAVLGSPSDDGMDPAGRHFCEWACKDGRRLKVYFEEGDLQAVEGWTLDNRDSIWVYALPPPRSLFDVIRDLLHL